MSFVDYIYKQTKQTLFDSKIFRLIYFNIFEYRFFIGIIQIKSLHKLRTPYLGGQDESIEDVLRTESGCWARYEDNKKLRLGT